MRLTTSVPLVAAFLALVGLPTAARADHYRPTFGTIELTITSVAPTEDGLLRISGVLDGRGTVIGHLTGSVQYDVNPVDGTFIGSVVKVTANGDELHEMLFGQLFEDGSGSVGLSLIDGGTGRFRKRHGWGYFESRFTSEATADVMFAGLISLGR